MWPKAMWLGPSGHPVWFHTRCDVAGMAIEHDTAKGNRSSGGSMTINEGGYYRLLSAIYDLALAPTDWPVVLRLLAEGLSCSYAAAITTTPERDTPCSLGAVGITADDHREFLRAWHKGNEIGRASCRERV